MSNHANTHVLILDGSLHPESYRPSAQWRRYLGEVPSTSVHLPSGETPPELADFTHLVLTGSEASIVDHQPWYEHEIAAVHEAAERGVPVLGSCFGHQMLALALSGEEAVAHSATPEFGWIEVRTEAEDPILEGFPAPFHCFASHFDEVRALPAPWRVLAHSSGCAVQMMRFGELPIYGIQAHPEIGAEEVPMLMRELLESMPEKADLVRPALEQEPRDDLLAGRLVRNFLRA